MTLSTHQRTTARLLGAAMALPLALGGSPKLAHAGTIGTPTDVNFGATTLDVEACSISQTGGTLGYSLDRKTIGTGGTAAAVVVDQGTAVGAQIEVNTNLDSGVLLFENPVLELSGGSPVPHTPTLSRSSEPLINGSNLLDLGVDFVATTGRFSPGTYSAKVTLTCTDDGTKTGGAS